MSDAPQERSDAERVTICVNTVDRPYCIQRLLKSIRKVYPTIRIIVADQNAEDPGLQGFYDEMRVRVVHVPYGAGVGLGRNTASQRVETEFIVYCDDDFLFSDETDFSPPIRIFEADPEVDILGGLVRDIVGRLEATTWEARRFEAFMVRDRERGLICAPDIDFFTPQRREVAGTAYFLSDTVLNWKICRREVIERGALWDPRFICNGEHEDFYMNVKENTDVKAAYCPSLIVYHHSPEDFAYSRRRNATDGWRLFATKWGVSEILQPLTAHRSIYSSGRIHAPPESTRDPLLLPDHAAFEFDTARLGADRPTAWPVSHAAVASPDPDQLAVTVVGASSSDILSDQPFSLLVRIDYAAAGVWGCLGVEAPELTYAFRVAGEGETLTQGARQTRLVQDITAGATFHYVNIDGLAKPDRRMLPGEAVDVWVELRRADGSTMASSPPHRIAISHAPGTYAANLGDRIEFDKEGLPNFIRALFGLSAVEDWGRWSDANVGEAVEIHFADDLPANFDLVIEYWTFGPNSGRPVLVRCGSCTATFIAAHDRETVRVRIRPLVPARSIAIIPPCPTSPRDLGLSDDPRRLGIALIALKIEAAGQTQT